MKKYALFLWLVALLAAPALLQGQSQYPSIDYGIGPAAFEQVGMSGWQFLKLPTNARTAALGGIVTALSHGDASSVWTNPASMCDVEKTDIQFSHMNWLVDIPCQTGSMVKNFGKWGYVGVSFVYVDYGDMPRTENRRLQDETGASTGQIRQILDNGTYTAYDYSVGLSYARQITDRFQVGGTLKYVSEKLDDAQTGQVAIDVGTVFYTGLKTFRIAMSGRNFGPDAEFVKYDVRIGWPAVAVRMPMVFALGGAIDILEGKNSSHLLTLAAEFVHPNDGAEKVNLGVEYGWMNFAFLRGGYRYNYDEEGKTLGAGLKVKPSGDMTLSINYAYMDFGRLSNVNMFTLGIGF
jgi:hypothetical protein